MKANELRIGNYVYRQSSKLIVDKSSIYQIENVNIQSAFRYDPIPLTEEWLLKFGFVHVNDDLFKLHITESVLLIVNLNFLSKDIAICINNQRFYMRKKYVHQLQNLFFDLKGGEL